MIAYLVSLPFWHETDSFGGLTNPHPRVTQHSRTYSHDSERPADPQPYPEAVHRVCRLHKQWHQDYVQLKVWYKNNDNDNTGRVLNEYLALCVFSSSELFHRTKTRKKKVFGENGWLSEEISTWRCSWSPGCWVSDGARLTLWHFSTENIDHTKTPLTDGEVLSAFAEMHQVAVC